MADEVWIKMLKEKLKDYNTPPQPNGWQQLERELASAKPLGVGQNRSKRLYLHRWSVGIAAALLAGISAVGIWLMQLPEIQEMRMEAEHTMPVSHSTSETVTSNPQQRVSTLEARQLPAFSATDNPSVVRSNETSVSRESILHNTIISAQSGKQRSLIGTENSTSSAAPQPSANTGIFETSKPQPALSESSANSSDLSTDDRQRQDIVRQDLEETTQYMGAPRRNPSADSYHPSHRQTDGRWSLALSVGKPGGRTSGNDFLPTGIQQSPSANVLGTRIERPMMGVGTAVVYENQELVFENGTPFQQNDKRRITSAHHKLPVSVGVTVRKELPRRFSVETGLVYTFLASDICYEDSPEELSQKLHYIGIPFRANWSFVRTSQFDVYVSAGGMVEKCVYGKLGTESQTVKPVQWSLTGSVGAQYNISQHVGIYVEPGVAYFFDDGTEVATIRKENPCNFTLQAGLRLTY